MEEYFVEWEDLAAPSDEDKGIVEGKVIEAVSKYVQAGVDTLIPPMEFFTMIMGMPAETAEAIITAADEQAEELDLEEEELGPEPEEVMGEEIESQDLVPEEDEEEDDDEEDEETEGELIDE